MFDVSCMIQLPIRRSSDILAMKREGFPTAILGDSTVVQLIRSHRPPCRSSQFYLNRYGIKTTVFWSFHLIYVKYISRRQSIHIYALLWRCIIVVSMIIPVVVRKMILNMKWHMYTVKGIYYKINDRVDVAHSDDVVG
jgi:hypothetical protein